jgi:hypothetical protein
MYGTDLKRQKLGKVMPGACKKKAPGSCKEDPGAYKEGATSHM